MVTLLSTEYSEVLHSQSTVEYSYSKILVAPCTLVKLLFNKRSIVLTVTGMRSTVETACYDQAIFVIITTIITTTTTCLVRSGFSILGRSGFGVQVQPVVGPVRRTLVLRSPFHVCREPSII